MGVDAEGLAKALRAALRGEVRFDNGSRHLYATDASNFRQVPIGVVVPRTIDDLVATHEVCREFGVPITNRGGGTSLAGQACNVAVVIDSSKYLRRIVEINADGRYAITEPGVVLDELRLRTQREHGLTWGPDPSTHDRCTMGGLVGNNACGVHAYAHGRTDENVEALEILTSDGERMWVGATPEDELAAVVAGGGRRGGIYRDLRALRDRYAALVRERFPDIPRRVSGYNLTELLPERGFHVARALVGTEGTCVTYLHVKASLTPHRAHRVLAIAGYPDIYAAADHVPLVNAWGRGTKASALEGLDRHLIENIAAKHLRPDELPDLPQQGAWLLVELHGETLEEARRNADELRELLLDQAAPPQVAIYTDPSQQAAVWRAREAGLGVTARIGGVDHWPGWEDSAVAPDEVPAYLRALGALFDRHGYDVAVYGHLGDGCIHCRIPFDLTSPDGIARYRSFLDEAADLCHAFGGSFSGEHGDGQQRGPLLEKMFGAELVGAFREFKAIWDPDNAMNPGKVVDAFAVDENLRLAGSRPSEPEVRFGYPEDDGSFSRATLRCVGVGKCRRADGAGTMCPSYFVTREEMHSTRGRAHLLYEMLRPDSDLDGWRDEHVKEALELCLSCKGCTVDCPVDVDMPTYKAEFFHHHYAGRRHPRVHYALGRIDVWSRLARRMPRAVNRALDAPGLGRLLKRAAGVATERPAPRYADETFRDWWRRRPPQNLDRPTVLLFPDTFTNHFWPGVGRSAVGVLEDAGFRVTLPEQTLCCGRPLYDFGFLDRAGRYLEEMVTLLHPSAAAGVAIVGLEPSCVAVLRDELVKMRPGDPRAERVARSTHTLAEFLVDVADYGLPRLERRAIVHGHCHQKGAIGMEADFRAFRRMGLDFAELDASCCGLAGSFGFEAGEKYELSVAMGEQRLLPAVRDAPATTLVVADGFSCRTQIEHLQLLNGPGPAGHRRALHLAQLIAMAHDYGPAGVPGHVLPEEPYTLDADRRAD